MSAAAEPGPDLLFASDVAVAEVWLELPDGTRVRYVREDDRAALAAAVFRLDLMAWSQGEVSSPDPWQPADGGWPT